MKPLPLLLSLFALALVGALLLTQLKPKSATPTGSTSSSQPEAPLPVDYVEPVPPLPRPPLLESTLIPDPNLIAFVENHLGLTFAEPPRFEPAAAEVLILTIEKGVATILATEQLDTLNQVARGIGALPSFQELDQIVITILAGEVRGLVTPTRNLILHDFQASSPPEQAALVNLLAQRLLAQKIPYPDSSQSVDEILAHHYLRQSLALATEREFRKTLPDYPPSLNENLRESILLGLPNFFHELSTFAEFHLLKGLERATPEQALTALIQPSPTPSRQLLGYPFSPTGSLATTELGAIPLYLILLEATDPTSARTLATALVSDQISFSEEAFSWTLTFASEKSPPRVESLFGSYFALRDAERRLTLSVEGRKLVITSTKK